MNPINIKRAIRKHFPIFDQDELIELIAVRGIYKHIATDQVILQAGSFIEVIPLVLEGSIKIVRQEEDKEIFLYYIKAGESCAMTLASCMKREKSKIVALVQESTQLIALPAEEVYQFMRKYPAWQDFVVDTYSRRFEEVLTVLDNVAFHKMDERLVSYLSKKSATLGSKELTTSHQDIADDLATSREVISRLLKQLERQGNVVLSRGKITLTNS